MEAIPFPGIPTGIFFALVVNCLASLIAARRVGRVFWFLSGRFGNNQGW
jgi:hypothetical protein